MNRCETGNIVKAVSPMPPTRDVPNKAPVSARGFGLIELMVSMAIASFLVLGLVAMAGSMQTTFTAQTNIAAVHDKERFASALFGSMLQTSGYYTVAYNATTQAITSNTVLTPVTTANAPGQVYTSGQYISGSGPTAGGGPDVLNVRYYVGNGDSSSANCLSNSVSGTPSPVIVESVLSISGGNLVCQVGENGAAPTGALTGGTSGTSVVLIDGVSNMQVFYNVLSGGQMRYYRSTDMSAATWTSVKSVTVNLTFTDPSSTQTYPFSQTYQVMYGSP